MGFGKRAYNMTNFEKPLSVLAIAMKAANDLKDSVVLRTIPADDASFTRILKRGMTGADVRAVKEKLHALGYLNICTHSTYGYDTWKAVRAYQSSTGLVVDGIVGLITWNSLFTPSVSDWSRTISIGMSGDDVLAVKKRLVQIGYLAKCTHNRFGNDTKSAVEFMQNMNQLDVTGRVDAATWRCLFSDEVARPDEIDANEIAIPSHISAGLAKILRESLSKVSASRRDTVLEIIKYAIDPDNLQPYIKGMYRRGGNFYTPSLLPNLMSESKLKTYFKNAAYAKYYDGGRQEMMEEASKACGYTLMGCDCSGQCTVWRGIKGGDGSYLVPSGWDATANGIYSRYSTPTTNPIPGDVAHKDGHIGIVIAPNYVCEYVGGAYGCQITKISNRRVYNYVKKKFQTMGSWEHFGTPKVYK
jgi:peptidoglycan hydrolase-like protein with peptidoglycan-binding domain